MAEPTRYVATPAGRAAGVLAGHPSTAARARRFGATEGRPVAVDRAPVHTGFSRSGAASSTSAASSAASTGTRTRRTRPTTATSTTGAGSSTTPAGRGRQPRASYRSGSNRSGLRLGTPLKGMSGSQHTVMALFLVSMLIVILRSVADYVPQEDQSQPGKVTPMKGLGPLPLAASLCVWYFVLASVAVVRGWPGKTAVGLGGLTTIALLLNSTGELSTVEGWIKNLGAPPSPVLLPTAVGAGSGSSSSGAGGTGGSVTATNNALGAFERAVNDHNWNAAHDALNALKATGDLTVASIDALQSELDAEKAGAGPLPGPAGLGVTLLQGAEDAGNAIKHFLGF